MPDAPIVSCRNLHTTGSHSNSLRAARGKCEDGRGNSAPDATPFPYHRNGVGLQAHKIATPSAHNDDVERLGMAGRSCTFKWRRASAHTTSFPKPGFQGTDIWFQPLVIHDFLPPRGHCYCSKSSISSPTESKVLTRPASMSSSASLSPSCHFLVQK